MLDGVTDVFASHEVEGDSTLQKLCDPGPGGLELCRGEPYHGEVHVGRLGRHAIGDGAEEDDLASPSVEEHRNRQLGPFPQLHFSHCARSLLTRDALSPTEDVPFKLHARSISKRGPQAGVLTALPPGTYRATRQEPG